MRDTVINHLNGGRGMSGRVPVRRGKTISWIDAPDDVYFFATDNTRFVFKPSFFIWAFKSVPHQLNRDLAFLQKLFFKIRTEKALRCNPSQLSLCLWNVASARKILVLFQYQQFLIPPFKLLWKFYSGVFGNKCTANQKISIIRTSGSFIHKLVSFSKKRKEKK